MVDTFVIVADGVDGALPSPATVDLGRGLNEVTCVVPDGSVFAGSTVTAG